VLPTLHDQPTAPLPSDIRRVLLGTDLGKATELATDRAFEVAHRYGAELLVVSVIEPKDPRQPIGSDEIRWDQIRDRRHDAAGALVARGRALGIAVSFLVWTGDPGESIVSAAQAEDVDLIVVGTHGRGRIGRLLLGSVSEAVVRNAPCPVLVIPPDPGGSHRPAAA
jgi:nucleotide-binding universal stress UspA family protein